MNAKANAVLLRALTKSSKGKASPVCDSHTKAEARESRVTVALADAGRDDWTRFKRECVLLKRG